MKTIQVLFEHSGDKVPHGSSYLRLLRPFSHPALEGRFRMHATDHWQEGDIVVVDRFWRPDITIDMADELVERTRKSGQALVYSLDDNLLDLTDHMVAPNPRLYEKQVVSRRFARAADLVLVSTEPLAQRMRKFNSRVVCIPNALDERLIAQPVRRRETIVTMGYMGTPTHEEDFFSVLKPLRELLVKHGKRVRLEIVGAVRNRVVESSLPNCRRLDPGSRVEYPEFWKWMSQNLNWDIGIAPLGVSGFNRCKSDIKFLDYTALGAATVASRVEAYTATVREGETALLAGPGETGWFEALDTLISETERRLDVVSRAREYLFKARTLSVSAELWASALNTL